MRIGHIIVAGHDSFGERSNDEWTAANEIVSKAETEVLKPSVIGSVIEKLDPVCLVRVSAGVLHHGQGQTDIHGKSSCDAVVEVHGQNVGTNPAFVLPVSVH